MILTAQRTSRRKEHLWVGEQMIRLPALGSVSGVEVHGAGAQAPALPEVTASPSLTKKHKTDAAGGLKHISYDNVADI